MIAQGIDLDTPAMRDFCRKWKIKELSVFGSILRDDFRPDSDIDFLVEFQKAAEWGLEERLEMQEELELILGRSVDLATKEGLKWVVRDRILHSAQVIHAA